MPIIYAFRHGQAERNLHPELVGGRSNESPLTELGIEQAKKLGAYIVNTDTQFDIVQSSPAVRALDTAQIALPSRRVHVAPDLQEISRGDSEGEVRDTVFTPKVRVREGSLGMDFKLPGWESVRDVSERAFYHVHDTVSVLPDDYSVAMFTHEVWIKSLVAELLGKDYPWVMQTRLGNCSLTIFTLEGGRLVVDPQSVGIDTLQ